MTTKAESTREKLAHEHKLNEGQSYKAAHLGNLAALDQYPMFVPSLNREVRGKVFIQDLVGTTGCELSMNKLPAGVTVPFSHTHKENEEVFIFIKGQGQMAIDADVFDVAEGSVVRLAPAAVRCLRNTGKEELYYICIQSKAGSLGQHTFDDGVKVDHQINWPQL